MADVKVTLNKQAIAERLAKQHEKAQFIMSQQALKDCNFLLQTGSGRSD